MEGDRGVVARMRASARQIASTFLALFQIYFAVLYLFPVLVTPPTPAPTIKVVLFIQSLGPYYTLGFAVSGGVLLLTLLWRRSLAFIGHLACFSVFFAYTVALFLGAFSASPHGTLIAPSLCLVPVVGHALLALSYGGERR